MDKTKALQKLLDGTATKKDIELLRQSFASGEIFIGRDVNRSVSSSAAATRLKQLQDWLKEHCEQLSPLEKEV